MKHFCFEFNEEKDLQEIFHKVASHPASRTLIQVFCGRSNQDEIKTLRAKLIQNLPGVAIIGASSAGEIINTQDIINSIVISVSLFEQTEVKTVLIDQNDDLSAAGLKMGAELAKNSPRAVIAFGCGIKNGNFVNSNDFLQSLNNQLHDIVIAGGQSGGTDTLDSNVFVFTEKGFSNEGFAAASLANPELCINTFYALGWAPLGKKMTVTQAQGNSLYSLDDKPVAEIYKYYLGLESEKSSLYLINHFPLMIERGDIWFTNPIAEINEDGSFELIQKVHTGEQVRFSFYDASLLEENALHLKQKIEGYTPEAVFVYSCAFRKELLGKNISLEMEALKSCKNSAGFFTFGEYFTAPMEPTHFFQQTMTVLALSESDRCISENNLGHQDEIGYQGLDLRRFQLHKVLGHLVASTTEELEATNQTLAELANKDALTGLHNRRRFDEMLQLRLKEHTRSGVAITLILIDVDYFKKFNDIYGHVVGDDCLRGIAHALQGELRRPSDMAFRYGGEEFGAILSFTNYEGALTVAENIRSHVESLAITHEGSDINEYVTVSIGVLTMSGNHELSPLEVVSTCDELLYKAKNGGRNRIAGMKLNRKG